MDNKRKYFMWGGCILLVLIVIGLGIFTGYKLYEDSKVTEEDVDETVYSTSTDSSQFAIYITGVGAYDGVGWPTSELYEFDSTHSYCIDSEGNKDYGVISYENGKVKFYTSSFKSCSIYFKESKITNLTQAYNKWDEIDNIIDNDGTDDIEDIWESTLTGDGYRYVGTDPDNYICFGTTDVEECTSKPNLYMYRIIGIFADSSGNYHLKLIKKEALDSTYQWNSSNTSNTNWGKSSLSTGLNGSYFLTNTQTYSYMQNSTWSNMITSWTWTAVNTLTISSAGYGLMYSNNTVRTVYYHETKQTGYITDLCYYGYYGNGTTTTCSRGNWTTSIAKISVMYVSDYLLSMGSSLLDTAASSAASTLKNGWMHLSNNDSSAVSEHEWTMARPGAAGTDQSQYFAYYITGNGGIGYQPMIASGTSYSYPSVARPVFYLQNSARVIDGIGTIDDPYILEA